MNILSNQSNLRIAGISVSALAAAVLAGCSTIGKSFDNNVYCKPGEPIAVAVSQWGPFGIASTLANGDKICAVAATSTAASASQPAK